GQRGGCRRPWLWSPVREPSGRFACGLRYAHAPCRAVWWSGRVPVLHEGIAHGDPRLCTVRAEDDMRLSISNIAWDVEEDPAVADLLRGLGIDAIDIAPGKYFSRPANATDVEIEAVRRAWEDRGISIVGMQALLFGTEGLNLFGPASVQEAMLAHLAVVCRIGAGLGATWLVFGS